MDIASALGTAAQMANSGFGADLVGQLLALFDNPQHRRLMKLSTPLSDLKEMLLQALSGHETLCAPYRFELTLLARDAAIDLTSLLGKGVLIELQLSNGRYRPIHGHVTCFSHDTSDGGIGVYSATVEPWLSLLAHRTNARIFQEKTVQQVLVTLFGEHSPYAHFEFRLSRTLPTRSYITQYNESDLAFVQRLLEQEGLVYYFEHSKEQHTLIVTDDTSRIPDLPDQPSIRYHTANITEEEDAITVWQAVRRLQVGRVSTQTFDYRQPGNPLPVSMDTVTQQGDVPVFERFLYHGAYTHGSFDRGQTLIRRQLETLEAESQQFYGQSACRTLQPGYSFELRQHYRSAGDGRRFRLLSVTHTAINNYLNQQEAAHYANHFACIKDKLPFHPLPSMRKPSVAGPQTAIVVGPKGEVMHTDALGRIRVQFHWDRYGQHDEKSSCWVRVMQPWASTGFGAISLPRIGDEVVVNFMDGDPDRPLVTGSLYNQQQQPPWELPGQQTQSGFMSRSFKGGANNANILRFDDKLGAEQFYLHAERNMDTVVEVDDQQSVGGNRTVDIKGSDRTSVDKGEMTIDVKEQHFKLSAKTNITLKLSDHQLVEIDHAGTLTLKMGSSEIVMTKAGDITVKGKRIELDASESIKGNANSSVKLSAGRIDLNQ